MSAAQNPPSRPLLWRRLAWMEIVGCMSPATFYREVAAGHIQTVKIGTSTRVSTSPEAYVAARIAEQAEAEAGASKRAQQLVEARRAKADRKDRRRHPEEHHPVTN